MSNILVAFFKFFFPDSVAGSHEQSWNPSVNEEFRYSASLNTALPETVSQAPPFHPWYGRFTRTASRLSVTTDQGDCLRKPSRVDLRRSRLLPEIELRRGSSALPCGRVENPLCANATISPLLPR